MNGYRGQQINRALNPPQRVAPPNEVLDFVSFLRYLGLILNHVSRKQFWHIKLVALLPRIISDFLWPVQDNQEYNSIPSECGQIYSEQTNCSIDIMCLDHLDK
jgi:hypothetical protein